jgi:hypothetical protein
MVDHLDGALRNEAKEQIVGIRINYWPMHMIYHDLFCHPPIICDVIRAVLFDSEVGCTCQSLEVQILDTIPRAGHNHW